GPTFALTAYVVGIQLTSALGATWSVIPVLSRLPDVGGDFEMPLGWFGVEWSVNNDPDKFSIVVETPDGTNGTVIIPGSG
ncbi:hypothetical protein K435DRAFT_616592, partial [Dendrothele bispora CBS 962.96]